MYRVQSGGDAGSNRATKTAIVRTARVRPAPCCDYNLWCAETAGVGRPLAKADSDHIGDHPTDVTLLGGIVVGPGMIAGDGHRPGLVPGVQLCEEACRVVNVATRVEHVLDAAKLVAVIAMVDLHAAKIDQGLAFAPCNLEGQQRFRTGAREDGFPFYIQCVGLKAALVSGFRQTNRIENAGRYLVAVRGAQDLGFAGIGRCRGRLGYRRAR